MKSICFAFAVNNDGRFEEKHFSAAEKYLIYEWSDNEFSFIKEEINSFKSSNEVLNASTEKGSACVNLLEKNGVSVLVSRQFGNSIRSVSKLFIPVVVNSESSEDVVFVLKKHIRWIEDELNSKTAEYKLFLIRKGILKTSLSKVTF